MSDYISKWLVLGPIFNKNHQSASHHEEDGHPLAAALIEDIDTASVSPVNITLSLCSSPKEGESATYCSKLYEKSSHTWKKREFKISDWSDISQVGDNVHKLAPEFSDKHHSLAFFLVYVDSPEYRKTELIVRSDDSIRVWLNGSEIGELKHAGEREIDDKETSAEVQLLKGTNILLAAVTETHVEWSFSAAFANGAGLTYETTKPVGADTYPPGQNGVVLSLPRMAENYSIFEKDQVLTHEQLNSIGEYFDDQTRLTRVCLLGAGIVCGFRVSLLNNRVTVEKGTGITTDGDLICFPVPRTFDRFKQHGTNRPAYAPFYRNDLNKKEMIPLYELLWDELPADDVATPLEKFTNETKFKLNEMVVLLYVESFVTDLDICSATDCDNLGQDKVNLVKVLVAGNDLLDYLRPEPGYGTDKEIPEKIAIYRPLFTSYFERSREIKTGFDVKESYQVFAEMYLSSCEEIHIQLLEGLSKLCKYFSSTAADLFPEDSIRESIEKLEEVRSIYRKRPFGVQYYYDFLKDLGEIINEILELAATDAVCCLKMDLFPKHLVLGFPNGGGYRTGFYPSELVSRFRERIEHARFLARKLKLLIRLFKVPETVKWFDIVPSKGEEWPLEERAIPYYYLADTRNIDALRENWTYRLAPTGMGRYTYSFMGLKKGNDQSLAEKRFRFTDFQSKSVGKALQYCFLSIRGLPFYRIEGLLGRNPADILPILKRIILYLNLPFSVVAVTLSDSSKVSTVEKGVVKALRERLASLIGKVKERLVKLNVAIDRMLDVGPARRYCDLIVQQIRKQKNTDEDLLKEIGEIANYFDYLLKHAVKFVDLDDELPLVEEYCTALLEVKRVTTRPPHLFDFIVDNPGLEHCGGVIRGGTFVVIEYEGYIIGDFMLPYMLNQQILSTPEPEEPKEPTEPTKPDEPVEPDKPDIHIDPGDLPETKPNPWDPTWVENENVYVIQPPDKAAKNVWDRVINVSAGKVATKQTPQAPKVDTNVNTPGT